MLILIASKHCLSACIGVKFDVYLKMFHLWTDPENTVSDVYAVPRNVNNISNIEAISLSNKFKLCTINCIKKCSEFFTKITFVVINHVSTTIIVLPSTMFYFFNVMFLSVSDKISLSFTRLLACLLAWFFAFFLWVELAHNVTSVSGMQHNNSTSLYIMLCSPQM